MPESAQPARPVLQDLAPSAALSILRYGPKSFKGHKLRVLVTDGVDAALLGALREAVQ